MTGLGKKKIILGFSWLNKYNPIINWKKGEIKWQPLKINWKGLLEKGQRIRMEQQPKVEEIVDEEETKNHMNNLIKEDKDTILMKLLEEMTWINKTNVATKLAIKESNKKEEKTDKELVCISWTSLVKKRLTNSLTLTLGPQDRNEGRI